MKNEKRRISVSKKTMPEFDADMPDGEPSWRKTIDKKKAGIKKKSFYQ